MKKLLLGPAVFTIMFAFTSVASATTTLAVPDGGTGNTSLTQDYFLLGNGTDPIIASSSPTLFETLFSSLVNAYSIPHVAGSSVGNLLSWTGSAWASISTSSLGLTASAAGTSTNIQFSNNGALAADNNLSFYSARTSSFGGSFSGPMLQVGNDDDAAVNIYTRNPDPAGWISGGDAPTGSNQRGTIMLMTGGNSDGTNVGGGIWLQSGLGSGDEEDGGINIFANPSTDNGGPITIRTTDAGMDLSETGAISMHTDSGTGTNLGMAFGIFNFHGHIAVSGDAPTVGSGSSDCGDDPYVAGQDNAGRVHVGSGTNGGVCTITFADEWEFAGAGPVCIVQEEGSATQVYPANVTTTGFEIHGSLSAGDVIAYHCIGNY